MSAACKECGTRRHGLIAETLCDGDEMHPHQAIARNNSIYCIKKFVANETRQEFPPAYNKNLEGESMTHNDPIRPRNHPTKGRYIYVNTTGKE
jgi:hypothetical protein